jgi:hypothetical protein
MGLGFVCDPYFPQPFEADFVLLWFHMRKLRLTEVPRTTQVLTGTVQMGVISLCVCVCVCVCVYVGTQLLQRKKKLLLLSGYIL